MNNPFTYGPRINDPSRFVDREEEIAAIYRLSSNHICCSLVGERRVGKSSLLRQISLSPTIRQLGGPHGVVATKFVFVLVDLQKVAGQSTEVFWRFLAQEIASTLATGKRKAGTLKAVETLQATLHGPEFAFIQLEDFLSKLAHDDIHLVILLDEFEYLTEDADFDFSFFGQLRSLADGRALSFITASADSLLDLTYRSQSAKTSPFFNIFTPHPLKLFTEEAAQQLLRYPVLNQKSPFTDQDVEFLLDLAGSHPYFLQWAGYILFDQYQSLRVTSSEVRYRTVQRLFDEQTSDQFQYYWGKLNPPERQALYEIAHGASLAAASSPVIRKLITRSLIYEAAGKPHLFSGAFARFVRNQEVDEGRRDLRTLPPGFTDKLKNLIVRFYQANGYFVEEDAPPLKAKQVSAFEITLRKPAMFQSDYIFIDLEQERVSELTEFLQRVRTSDSHSHFTFIFISPRSELNIHPHAGIQENSSPHHRKIWFREQLVTEFGSRPELKAELLTLLRTVSDL